MKQHILVVDDEPDIRRLVGEILEDEGYSVVAAKDGTAARDAIAVRVPNLVLLDIWMPDVDGITLLKEFTNVYQLNCPVIMMSGHGTVEAAVEATRLGAFDFIEKPLSLSKLLLTVERALASGSSTAVAYPSSFVHEPVEIVGKSNIIRGLIETLERAAEHDVSVLLVGEVGAGKSLCARYLHSKSPRKQGPFVELRSSNLQNINSDNGVEILLGKDDAGTSKPGVLEKANGGTLYVEDIAELDDAMQNTLYGFLHSPTVFRVNGSDAKRFDVRIVAATRYDLNQEVRAKRFREELFHSISTLPVRVPALREHSEDVPELLQYYIGVFADKERLPYRNFTLAAQNRLRNYHWPGNIMELENLVRRLLIKGGESNVDVAEVDGEISSSMLSVGNATVDNTFIQQFDLPLRQAREQFEKAYLEFHLKKFDGSVGKVAKLAGLERTHLYRKLRALGIETKQ